MSVASCCWDAGRRRHLCWLVSRRLQRADHGPGYKRHPRLGTVRAGLENALADPAIAAARSPPSTAGGAAYVRVARSLAAARR
jgi:hypothetical protein